MPPRPTDTDAALLAEPDFVLRRRAVNATGIRDLLTGGLFLWAGAAAAIGLILTTRWRAPALIPLALGLLGFRGWLQARRDRRAREAGLLCPGCGVSLVDWFRPTLKGDRCARCTRRVIAAPDGRRDGARAPRAELLSAAELAERRLLVRHGGGRPLWMAGSVALAGCALAASAAPAGLSRAWQVAGLIVAAAGVVATLLVASVGYERSLTRLGLRCPSCRGPLIGGKHEAITRTSVETERCLRCGARALAATDTAA
ncbi:MAG TPA: hypothetical protein VNA89_16055 [Gemmatimonadaceae bacterium]|nr:hypothetical protein [Gemmatimonadaceae bacterium]